MMPWLRSRVITESGNIIFTTAVYHPSNLLYQFEKCGGIEAIDALWEPNKLLPAIEWSAYPAFAHAQAEWKRFLEWDILKSHLPTKELDQAAKILADVFCS